MYFTPEFFEGNRRRLFEQAEVDLIVVSANTQLQRSADTAFPFRQDSNFWYLTGIDHPDCVLVITKRSSYIIVPSTHWSIAAFDEALDTAEASTQSGITQYLTGLTGWRKLKKQIAEADKIGALFPSSLGPWPIAVNPARNRLIKRLKRTRPGLELVDLRLQLAHMRMVKQPAELKVLRQTVAITKQTLAEVFSEAWYERYDYEYQLAADITASFARAQTVHGYTPIVASGKNACVIHYEANKAKLPKGKLLMIDVGAELHNYTADISRTYTIGARATKRQQEILHGIQEAQNYALSLLKPGVQLRDYEQTMEAYMGELFKRFGLLKKITRKKVRQFYPQLTSHMLGLDAHDACDYSQPLAENMVLTVEPAVYIPEEGIGVRIEDDVRITKSGTEVL